MAKTISKVYLITDGIIYFKLGFSVNNAGFILASKKKTFKSLSTIKSNPNNSNSPF